MVLIDPNLEFHECNSTSAPTSANYNALGLDQALYLIQNCPSIIFLFIIYRLCLN